jgi:aminomethyltransferase
MHTEADPLARTALHAVHVRLGARMVPFAGYDMPLQYAGGIIKEHLHTRAQAGLFDVSHMGQIALAARSGRIEDAARALESLVPADIAGLKPGRQRYTQFTNDAGGIIDDLMISHQGDHLLLVVNAAGKVADEAHLRSALAQFCTVEPLRDRALIALQGPAAEAALAQLAPEVRSLRFMDARKIAVVDEPCVVSRSGYTGEDGFEIAVAAAKAEALWTALLENPAVAPVGLGARDSLRLEASLPLYGSDIDATTTPVEAALEWSIPKVRREGPRAGGFPGAGPILHQLAAGVSRRRVGLKPQGRAPVRAGAPLYRAETASRSIGTVTSGGFGVSLGAPVAMGYVEPGDAAAGTLLFAEVRGKRLPVRVADLPFVPHHYKR